MFQGMKKNKFSNNVRSKYADQCKKNVIQLANPGKAYSITAQESRQGEGKLHTHMLSFHHTEHPGMQVKGSGEIKMISLNQTVFNLTRKIKKKQCRLWKICRYKPHKSKEY
jgi:hypothetical protein